MKILRFFLNNKLLKNSEEFQVSTTNMFNLKLKASEAWPA